MPYTCDNASVGVLIRDAEGRYLMLHRAWFPVGVAPVAGHVFDEHEGYMEAARAEVEEEAGMHVTSLELLPVGGWRPNKCGATDPGTDPRAPGHNWQIFYAEATGTPRATSEAKSVAWLTQPNLQFLAERTSAYAQRLISQERFDPKPGLEPVWCDFFAELGLVMLQPSELEAIAYVAEHGHPRPVTA